MKFSKQIRLRYSFLTKNFFLPIYRKYEIDFEIIICYTFLRSVFIKIHLNMWHKLYFYFEEREQIMSKTKKSVFLGVCKELWYCLIPALFTVIVLFAVFFKVGLYPFGDGSIAWCDMRQQCIPLLADLKDILDGKESVLFSMENAAGMNFWGVFCFFISSPINLLVKFVDKSELHRFMNILVTLKMALAAFTACLYFHYCHKKLSKLERIILSVVYAFCGYAMLYYQNHMWLDMMLLLPLLMISVDVMFRKGNNIPYIIMVALMMYNNFYIFFMVGIFVLVVVSGYMFFVDAKECKKNCYSKLIGGTVIALLMTSFVWLPCYLETMQSVRMESPIKTIQEANFLTPYQTNLPLVYCSTFIFAAVMVNVFRTKGHTKQEKFSLYLFIMTLVPIIIEPVNLIWHTGNYMCFPSRYAFVTIFCGLRCCAVYLERDGQDIAVQKTKLNKIAQAILIAICGIIIFYYAWFNAAFIYSNFKQLTEYTSSLWGKENSFDGLTAMFVMSMLMFSLIYILYKKRLLNRTAFGVILAVLVTAESVGNLYVYMLSPYINDPGQNDSYYSMMKLSEQVKAQDDSDEIYRVGTVMKVTDYNMPGAMGFNSISHYTSLTDKAYMQMHHRLGYNTVWVQAGSNGGTDLTDFLYGIKYKINWDDGKETCDAAYEGYRMESVPLYKGIGMITSKSIYQMQKIPEMYTRPEVQEYLYGALFGGNFVTYYNPDNPEKLYNTGDTYVVDKNTELIYTIKFNERQTLFADCSGEFSNSVRENFYESMNIYINDIEYRGTYPTEGENGLLRMGTFENEIVRIKIRFKKSIYVPSFGLFSIDNRKLETAIENTPMGKFTYKNGVISGTAEAGDNQVCLMSIPYNEGLTVKVNGKKVEYKSVLSDFVAFDLEKGHNDIKITFVPKGFILSAAVSLISLACLIAYGILIRKGKLKDNKKLNNVSELVVKLGVLAALAVIYLVPIFLNFTYVP